MATAEHEPLLPGGRPRKRPLRSRLTDVAVSIALPWLMFFLSICLFLFTYHDVPVLVWVVVGLCAALASSFTALGTLGKHSVFLALGFLCLAAIVVGTTIGMYLDSVYLQRYWRLENGVRYKDIDPTAPAGATSDAGIISFVNLSFVDDQRTLGFVGEDQINCVAPVVLPPEYTPRVEYWATGVDCCQKRANFDCGSAREPGPLRAVVAEQTPLFAKAVAMAGSVYGTESAGEAQLMEFVSDPEGHLLGIWDEALMVALMAALMHLVASIVAGLLLARVLPPAQHKA